MHSNTSSKHQLETQSHMRKARKIEYKVLHLVAQKHTVQLDKRIIHREMVNPK